MASSRLLGHWRGEGSRLWAFLSAAVGRVICLAVLCAGVVGLCSDRQLPARAKGR